MLGAIRDYFDELLRRTGEAWGRFWFQPAEIRPLCGLRIFVGLLGLWWWSSFAGDLLKWFGPTGMLPWQTVQLLRTGRPVDSGPLAEIATAPEWLWLGFAAGTVSMLLFTVGAWARGSGVAALVLTLLMLHRGPVLNGPFEPVLIMLLAYLCLAPIGRFWSIDAWRHRRAGQTEQVRPEWSVSARISQRLLQVHLSGLYLMMALTKLAAAVWWNGQAMWWLMAQSESRLIDLTFLREMPNLVYGWTHLVILTELAFALLIWVPLTRPLLIGLSTAVWISLAFPTGLLGFCAAMIVANLVFLPPAAWHCCIGDESLTTPVMGPVEVSK